MAEGVIVITRDDVKSLERAEEAAYAALRAIVDGNPAARAAWVLWQHAIDARIEAESALRRQGDSNG